MGSKSSIIYTLTTLAMAIAPAFAHAGSLPPLINFQSVLLDEGGNLLPSGPTTVQFQILDENQAPIYSETQNVDVVKGAVAALIGNGTDGKGTTTGGIPDDIFSSGTPRYLQVQVGSQVPEEPMTIVPVPYAQWSQTCATVVDGGIKANAIAKAAVGFEALAPDVVSKLASEMSKSQGVVTAQTLGATGGATQIGVEAKFINSGSSSVQGVLQDIDLSVKKSQEMDTFLTGKLNQEVTDRTNAISDTQAKLDQEVKDRTAADSGLQGQITKEISDRSIADTGIQNTIAAEIKSRSDANKVLQNQIDQVAGAQAADNAPQSPTLSGDVKYTDFKFFDYATGGTGVNSDVTGGVKFVAFNEQPTISQGSSAQLPADPSLYFCKVKILFDANNLVYPAYNSANIQATCEYSERMGEIASNPVDQTHYLQRGVLLKVYNTSTKTAHADRITIHFDLYKLPIATQ